MAGGKIKTRILRKMPGCAEDREPAGKEARTAVHQTAASDLPFEEGLPAAIKYHRWSKKTIGDRLERTQGKTVRFLPVFLMMLRRPRLCRQTCEAYQTSCQP